MKQRKLTAMLAASGLGLGLLGLSSNALAQEFITVGTGGVTGVYYPVGGAICRLVNAGRPQHGIRCSVESTGGSVYNVNTMRAGELDFGIVQSDVQFNAYTGAAQFDGNPYSQLRAVFGLHPEAFTVVSRTNANASEFAQLEGKRVNIGSPGSGQRATLEQLLALQDKTTSVYSLAADLRPAEMASALCDNRIDAMIYVVGHPNGSIKEATSTCSSRLVNVRGPAVDALLAQFPYYTKAVIAGGEYSGNPDPIETFGVAATFTASTDVPEETVYQLVKSVFERLEEFKRLHPALAVLTPENMVTSGLSAPLHPGAERYYREVGLID